MANSSISGLASGLDTATIIDQLMQLEAIPQRKLSTQKDNENSIIKALRAMNTDISLLASSAGKLAKAETWQTLKGTSSSTNVTVAVGATASAASFSITVDRLAAQHKVAFTDAAALTDTVSDGTVKLTDSKGVVHDLDTGGGTLSEVVSAINGSTDTTGVRATAVKVADGSYRLLVESVKTGSGEAFTLTNGDGSDLLGGTIVSEGADAQVSLGLGITATSATNTFTDLTPGVSLTLSPSTAIGTTATVTVAQSSTSISSTVSALVDQVNSILSSIDTSTAAKTSTSAGGVLSGDPVARSLRSALLNTVFGDGTTSLATYGIQTDRTGKLVFDSTKFAEAYAADPAGVAAKFTTGATPETNGWAARVEALAKGTTDSYTGTITGAITGHTSAVDRLTKSIDAWDVRLEKRRSTLERQYTALETALSKLQSQSSWLAGQIASLPSYSSR